MSKDIKKFEYRNCKDKLIIGHWFDRYRNYETKFTRHLLSVSRETVGHGPHVFGNSGIRSGFLSPLF